jgi:hypothetical protein
MENDVQEMEDERCTASDTPLRGEEEDRQRSVETGGPGRGSRPVGCEPDSERVGEVVDSRVFQDDGNVVVCKPVGEGGQIDEDGSEGDQGRGQPGVLRSRHYPHPRRKTIPPPGGPDVGLGESEAHLSPSVGPRVRVKRGVTFSPREGLKEQDSRHSEMGGPSP